MRLLLVEDEVQLAKSLKKILEHNKYNVDLVHDGLESLNFIETYKYDLILLDVMLPTLDGVNILRKIREFDLEVKVIMLTAKNSTNDKVNALDIGADDYITKPFASTELLARIRTQLRRKQVIINNYSFGDITLELDTCTLRNVSGEFILGKKEFLLLKLLIENKNQIISQDFLFNKIWDSESFVTENVLWTYISYIRKKLKLLKSNVSIKTTRGIGYSLEVMQC